MWRHGAPRAAAAGLSRRRVVAGAAAGLVPDDGPHDLGSIMVDADADPAIDGGEVMDSVGDGLAEVREVVELGFPHRFC